MRVTARGAGETAPEALLRYLGARLGPGELPHVGELGLRDAAGGRLPDPGDDGAPVPIHLTVRSAVLGPVVARGTGPTPCRSCLSLRWQRLRTAPERDALEHGRAVHPPRSSPYLTPFALDAIWRLWTALPRHAGGPRQPGIAPVYELDLRTLRTSRFSLITDAECPVCQPRRPDTAERAVLDLVPRPKPAPDRYRERSLRDLELPRLALVNPLCGAIGDRTLLDYTSPTTAPGVGMFRYRDRDGLQDVLWGGKTDSFGTSETSALLEGLERYAGLEQRHLDGVVVGSFDALAPDALDPRDCGLYRDEVYSSSERLVPFDPGRPIPWVWGYSLRDERPVLVPQRTVYYGRAGSGDNFVHESSNGCASGGSLEEAILHGMLELIERDSFLLAWYGRAPLPEIDPAGCRPGTRFMLDRVRLCGYDVRLFDMRIDFPVPAVLAVGVRRDGGPGTLSFAAGAGLDPQDAVAAALAEAASYAPTMSARFAERADEVEAMVGDFTRVRTLADHSALFTSPAMARHADFLLSSAERFPVAELYERWQRTRPTGTDLRADLVHCLDLFVAAGFDVLVVDQTAPEQELLGLRTVRVIVPGLVPIDFGWALQRALHLPRTRSAFRRAGWRNTELADAELHRVPHPFP